MILIFATQSDVCASQTYEVLKQQEADVIFIEMASDFLSTMGISWSINDSHHKGFLQFNSRKILLSDITSVLARKIYPSYIDPQLSEKDQYYVRSESHATFIGLLNSLDCPVINRPIPGMVRAPLFVEREQVIKAMQCGFKLPDMQMTSTYERALHFYNAHDQMAILGYPGSSPALIKDEEGTTHLQKVIRNREKSIYLQEVPEGKWLQAFVIGPQVIGTSFWFQAMDSEKQRVLFQDSEVPKQLKEQCIKLAQSLKLEFIQLILLQEQSGEIYCFDINDFPSINECEHRVQEKIVTALAKRLNEEVSQ